MTYYFANAEKSFDWSVHCSDEIKLLCAGITSQVNGKRFMRLIPFQTLNGHWRIHLGEETTEFSEEK